MNGLEITVLLGLAVLTATALAPRLRMAPPLMLVLMGLVLGFVPELREIEQLEAGGVPQVRLVGAAVVGQDALHGQLRSDTEGRAYYRRKLAAGKTPLEALRCLKRRLSDVVYRQLLADADTAEETGPGGHCGATQESSAVDLPPHIDTSDQPQPGPAQPTLPPTPPGQNPDAGSTTSPPHRPAPAHPHRRRDRGH